MISIKIYKEGDDLIIGACDEDLLGKKFVEGKFQIDVSRHFYNGRIVDNKLLEKYLQDATIANLVGNETIKCAIKLGLVDPDSILTIRGVPHAQMIRML